MVMQCILMNFDDRVRVVPTLDKTSAAIPIGFAKSVDVDEAIFNFIKKAMEKTGDPLIILAEMPEMPAEVVELMDILANIDTAPYDDILRRASILVGAENIGGPRPSRVEIRYKLRQIARQFAAGAKPSPEAIQSAAAEIEARNIAKEQRERQQQLDADPDEQDRKLREAREATQRAMRDGQPIGQMSERVLSEREKTDLDLGIVGATTDDLAAALNRPPQGQADPDAFDPGKEPRPAKRSASKQAKRAAKKPTRGRATSAKASSKRVRA